MANLTQPQKDFLKSQGISPSQVFDATNIKGKDKIQDLMTKAGLSFYLGSGCKAFGHQLKTKSGHCIQCHTARIAYQLRQTAEGYVYLVYSNSKKLVKVGFTKNEPKARADLLREEEYANAKDWQLQKYAHFTKDAGRIEFAIHSDLERYQARIQYEKYKGQMVECKEVFACDLQIALNSFVKHCQTKK